MSNIWPWLAIAGVGALHGLNPASGWVLATAWGVRSRDRSQALRALVPIAAGHAASIALVAAMVVFGLTMDRFALQLFVGILLAAAATAHLSGHTPRKMRVHSGYAGMALCSFMMSSAHGAGLMLVPALVPICAGDTGATPGTLTGPLALALAAVAVHTAAMLAVTGIVAIGVSRGVGAGVRLLGVRKPLQERARSAEGEETEGERLKGQG